MKEKMVSLKNKIVTYITENKKSAIVVSITLIIIIGIIVSIVGGVTKNKSTNGNLNNSGFTVKNRGWVYYLGFNEGQSDGIYKLKGNKNEKLVDDYALYLNESGKYIYYLDVGTEAIVKIKTNGRDKETIISEVDLEKIVLDGNWIYYFDESKLCRIKTNGKERQIVLEKSIDNYEIYEDWIYYSYRNNGKYVIAKISTNGKDNTKIDEDCGSTFFIKENYIYYIYENNNVEDNIFSYELHRIKKNGKKKEKITDLPKEMYIASINFNRDDIYYLKEVEGTNLAIHKMNLKDVEEKKVVDVDGYVTYINIVDNWIYYPDVNNNGNDGMYRIKTNGKEKQELTL
ncbi:MAG: DUF5050 domain-containing protein [Clostridia bacterium]|nr:DUF5050 domain-containing protein [Clostridia bacterium]